MDEGVKISQRNIIPNVQGMADIYIKSALRKSFFMHGFHFIGNHIFCTSRLIRFQYAVLHKNCCSPSINLKPFPMNFWRNWHLFEYQKRSNRIINKKVTEFCTNMHFREQLENIFFLTLIYLSISDRIWVAIVPVPILTHPSG